MIDYSKYDNLPKDVLVNRFLSLENKQKKLLGQLKENEEILKYLSEKIINAFTIKKEKYYTLKTSQALKKVEEWAKNNPKEAQKAKKEVLKEMGLIVENNL
ncbi:hypothetical protein [Helicobacter burdigaliensis]|uniref:hypothetical protein n=1 Tax=Helicobacter burdigaliensis TaxID=2315334 RepID=UPI000EF681C7|nr:hypothetical protein [Helicobacter burdigaliensis]